MAPDPASDLTRDLHRLSRAFALLLPAGVAAAAAALAGLGWPRYWRWIAPEQSPMAFLQAMLLFASAILAGLLALQAWLRRGGRAERHTWLAASAGLLFLTADERFALHERLRDGFLSRLGWGLPWGAPGDYVLLVYAAAGGIVWLRLLRLLHREPLSRRLFLEATLLAAAALAADTFDPGAMRPAVERIEQTLEEVVEAVAHALVATALFHRYAMGLARAMGPAGPGESPAREALPPAPTRSGSISPG